MKYQERITIKSLWKEPLRKLYQQNFSKMWLDRKELQFNKISKKKQDVTFSEKLSKKFMIQLQDKLKMLKKRIMKK